MSWQTEIETVFGHRVATATRMVGGDLTEALDVRLSDGTRMAVKRGRLVSVEARMLQAMRLARADVPAVLHAGGTLLCLDWIDSAQPTEDGWAALGTGLARLHRTEGTGYGWPEDYAFGAVEIDNRLREAWPDFWAEARLLPFLPHLDPASADRLERLARSLPDRLPRAPRPALLHGDLWSGNVLFAKDRAALIDPACYHGDAEVDLAMAHLFGRPPASFLRAYDALEPGHDERQPIYQLWPALVHARLFGAGYAGMVDRLLDAAKA